MQPQFFQIGITDCFVRMIAGFKESKIDAQVWLLAIVDRPMGRFQAETPVARNEDPNEAFHPPSFCAAPLRFVTTDTHEVESHTDLLKGRSRKQLGPIPPDVSEPRRTVFRKNARRPTGSERSRCGRTGRALKDLAESAP